MRLQGLVHLLRGERSAAYLWERLLGIGSRILGRRGHGRLYFEHIYRQEDPWNCTSSPYEQAKYAEILAALPSTHFRRALEVGCGLGIFTEQLARRCDFVDAIDFSARALGRARSRCQHLKEVHFHRCDLLGYFPPRPYDLVLCAEVLYYVWEIPSERAGVCARLAALTEPDGHLVIVMPEEAREQNWEQLLVRNGHFRLVNQRAYPDLSRAYRISILQRGPREAETSARPTASAS